MTAKCWPVSSRAIAVWRGNPAHMSMPISTHKAVLMATYVPVHMPMHMHTHMQTHTPTHMSTRMSMACMLLCVVGWFGCHAAMADMLQ